MLKRMSILLGVGLFVLWVAGLANPFTPGWMTWLDGLASLFAFAIAALTPTFAKRSTRMGQPIALAVGLFLLWIGGLNSDAPNSFAWWNFVFACGFLILGISAGRERIPPVIESPADLERERERRRSA